MHLIIYHTEKQLKVFSISRAYLKYMANLIPFEALGADPEILQKAAKLKSDISEPQKKKLGDS